MRILTNVELKVYRSEKPFAGLVLAHGAGSGQLSSFMVDAARGFAKRGVSVATFDFPYVTARRKVPDRAPVLEHAWRDAIDAARSQLGTLPLFIGGKSMGGRIATHVAAQKNVGTISGVLLLGYPLHPPGRPEQRRDAHLPDIAEPMLFIQGEKDTFGGTDEISALLPRLQRATLHGIPRGDHSFRVPGGKAKQPEVFENVLNVACEWMRSRAG
ncbi:MAG: alpha/beta family hydrolase [Vicinamibacterales bacterium]